MEKPDVVLLAAATRTIIDGINFREHGNIKEIYSTYDYDTQSGRYIPRIKIEMKGKEVKP